MNANWLDDDQEPADEISMETLILNGVHYQKLSTRVVDYQAPIDALKKGKGYIEQDEVSLSPETPNLESICAKFLEEHLHDEDEVRFVLDGEGVFDIRSLDDRWMRVHVSKGDLVVVPAKRYHRFFLTDAKQIHCVRLFQDQSGWVPHYRPA